MSGFPFLKKRFLEYSDNFVLHLQTPCSKNPCENGAKCIPLYEHDNYKCECPLGFEGKKCETGEFSDQ